MAKSVQQRAQKRFFIIGAHIYPLAASLRAFSRSKRPKGKTCCCRVAGGKCTSGSAIDTSSELLRRPQR
jgi:hypothetical protein